jgi:PAS domain S-box-containing protein
LEQFHVQVSRGIGPTSEWVRLGCARAAADEVGVTSDGRQDEFESAFAYAVIGMALVAPDGRFLKVNRALCELTGYTEEELLSGTFQDITHPEDLAADVAFVTELLAGTRDTYSMEKRYIGRDGRIVPVLLSVSLVRDADGEPVHFISQIQDRRAEVQRRELEAELAERRRADALEVLAGGVAHDFNNLLVAVLGHTSLALSHVPADSKARHNLHQIESTARRLAELTDQMLAFSGKILLDVRPLALEEHVREAFEAVEPALPAELEVAWSLAPGAPVVAADATQLLRVTTNLLVNAAEAVADGGDLSIATGGMYLTRAALDSYAIGKEAEPGLYGYVEVSDSGSGMDAETRDRMFEPFYTTKFAGRGLGLASVEGLIRAHRAALSVESAPGEGTRVRVLLPAAA